MLIKILNLPLTHLASPEGVSFGSGASEARILIFILNLGSRTFSITVEIIVFHYILGY